jgi:superfamily II DNA or RNA helicase
MGRGWTWKDGNGPTGETEETIDEKVKEEKIKELVKEWNALEKQVESIGFMDRDEQRDYEEGLRERAREARSSALSEGKTEEEAEEAYAKEFDRINDRGRRLTAKQGLIETMLDSLGARLMRPYEHWNEDERYMEYMENRYSSEY